MKSTRQPVSFIATDNRDAARIFYGDALGLKLREARPFTLVFGDGDQVLRVQIVSEFQRFDHLDQDAIGVWTTPDGNKIAWFTDPSGNTLSLTQYAKT